MGQSLAVQGYLVSLLPSPPHSATSPPSPCDQQEEPSQTSWALSIELCPPWYSTWWLVWGQWLFGSHWSYLNNEAACPGVIDWCLCAPEIRMLKPCDGIWRWSFWGMIWFRWSHEGGFHWWDERPYDKKKRTELLQSPPRENTVRRRPSASQRDGSH